MIKRFNFWWNAKGYDYFKKQSYSFLVTMLILIVILIIVFIGLIVLVFIPGVNFLTCLKGTVLLISIFILLFAGYGVIGVLEDKMNGWMMKG